MEFLYTNTPNGRAKLVTMEHKGKRLEWTIEIYRKFVANHFVFGDINRLLATLPEKDQDALWACYERIQDGFRDIRNLSRLNTAIKNELKAISDIFPYRLVLKDVVAKDTIWTPPEREDNSSPISRIAHTGDDSDENQRKTSLTYNKHDYNGLNSLIIYMKLYMPVLSQYYTSISDDTTEFFRCVCTMALLDKTEFIHEQGYRRLRDFVEHYWRGISDDSLAPSILVHGLSKDGAIDWILADLVMRRLLPIGVSHKYEDLPQSARPNFISGLFYYVQSNANYLIKGVDGKGSPNEHYMNKDTSVKGEEGEENQSSTLERYKIAGEMSEMNLVINNHFLSDISLIILHLDESLTLDEVESVMYNRHMHRTYHPFRHVMMQWLMASAVSPKYINYLSSVQHGPGVKTQQGIQYENCFKVCYALLRHWGFDDLAQIFDGQMTDAEPDIIFDIPDISAEQVREINKYYPHQISSNRVKGESKRSSSYPILACNQLEDSVRGRHFIGENTPGHWVCRFPVKYRLADLLIYMNKHQLINP